MRARSVAIAATLAWIIVAAWLASRGETWVAIWRLTCRLMSDLACPDATIYIVVNWPVIAIVALGPVVLGWLIGWGVCALKRLANRRSG